ncbi:HNH endonuclease [Morganella morganii]|uniref:HNH endonuclease n=1 Tax=Morganella morganii TaxID=582 RepID=UPI00313A3030
MKTKKKERRFVACFLSKFSVDNNPPIYLGSDSWKDAYKLFYPLLHEPAETFDSFRNSIKNERDRFDRFYETNPRKGWKKDKLSQSNELIKSTMDAMNDDDIFSHIKNILQLSMVEEIRNDQSITNTEKEQIILSRVGQGKFKKDCLSIYPSCIITGIELSFLLIASHIKPWSKSTNQERLNKYNGLILSPVYDKLFDKGYISFDHEGKLSVSSQISSINISLLKIDTNFQREFSDETKVFLQWHYKNLFKN